MSTTITPFSAPPTPVVLPLTGYFATTDPITFNKDTGEIKGLDTVGFIIDDPTIITKIVESLTTEIPVQLGSTPVTPSDPSSTPAAIVATSDTASIVATQDPSSTVTSSSTSGLTPAAVSLGTGTATSSSTPGSPPTSEYIEEMEDTKFSGGKSIKKRVRKNRKTKKHGNKKHRNKK